MSAPSRNVKNPLLLAAGAGSPFDHYAENTLLVPITPATPAVLRDDAELDNFVGQDPARPQDSPPSVADTSTRGVAVAHSTASAGVNLPPEVPKEPAGQPAKQGYFTSILSSLPNLSLSSITGDSPAPQASQGYESGATSDNNPYAASRDLRTSLPETPSFLAINPADLRSASPSAPSEVNSKVSGTIGAPPSQQTVPPSAPLSAGGPVSYRLGNQRRLKYVPPPDLTSGSAKQYPAPAVQSFLPPSSSHVPQNILNPNASYESSSSQAGLGTAVSQPIASFPVESLATTEQRARNAALQASFRASPTTSAAVGPSAAPYPGQNSYYENQIGGGPPTVVPSFAKAIPSRPPEPATPQNTPANFSFSGYAAYRSEQETLASSAAVRGGDALKDASETNTPSRTPKNCAPEPERKDLFATEGNESTFTLISAAKVTEKLEHFLAEREDVPAETVEGSGKPQTESSSVAEPQSTPQQEIRSFGKHNEYNSGGDLEKVDLSKSESLSDVFLGAEPVETTKTISQEVTTVNENVNVAGSNSHKQPPRQYYRTQPETVLPSTNFFVDTPSEQKTGLNYALPFDVALSKSPETDLYRPTPSSFFDSVENTGSYGAYRSKESTASDSLNNQGSAVFPSGSIDPVAPVPGSFLGAVEHSNSPAPDPACVSASQPPPPTFYNPAQLLGDSYNLATPSSSQAYPPFVSWPVSQPRYPEVTGVFSTPLVSMTTAVPEQTGSATLSPIEMSTNPIVSRTTPDTVPQNFQKLAAGSVDRRMQYRSVYQHWFYRKEVESKVIWLPFSMQDSLRLEDVHNSSEITPETKVATDGGRYDVEILRRRRSPVYWTGPSTEVRRCSWFYKGPSESRYIPYEESTAAKIEEEYKQAYVSNSWNRRLELNNGEYIIFHSASVQVHYLQASSPELAASWGNSAGSEDGTYLQGAASRPRVVKRGVDEFNIDDGEPEKVDHLLFLVHGIGSVCDLKFRTVEEVVDEFRNISLQLVQSHYRTASEQGIVNRIEVLPISWHATLHSEDTGIDKKLQAITLESIPKLRHFTNDTLLDILFYTSPIYCQTIMQTVGNEMNRLYTLFKERNPGFDGGLYLGGHSLGSLILFDLLCHQKPLAEDSPNESVTAEDGSSQSADDSVGPIKPLPAPVLKRRLSKKISYVMGAAGTGQPYINYPQLHFHPRAFFALGSPIGMFVTVRGIDTLGEDFALPTCPAFFNVFHPFDPVAYRVESLINPESHKFRPMLIPHHKGRKRMHLELKETMARVGADLKQKLLDSVRNTWNSVYQLALFHRSDNVLEREIDKVVEEELQKPTAVPEQPANDDGGADVKIGKLNGGRRIDYVLQEAPFEYINEYIFALTSHVCYWESEDTMLMILKEIYGSMGIQTDAQLPQQTLSIERATPSPSTSSSPCTSIRDDLGSTVPVVGVDPTAPLTGKPIGPPPKSGFVRKM